LVEKVIENKLNQEKKAFDKQILERVKNGHIPDLRNAVRNEWFYNNVWRDPEYLKLSFIENLNYFLKFIKSNSNILEVGCGPGHISLELARNNHFVRGIDLSPECIEVAKVTANNNKFKDTFGSLEYDCGDFLNIDFPKNNFDAVLFYGSLSHFEKIDIVLDKVSWILKPNGRILVYDTSVDQYDDGDAAILYMMCAILSFTGHFYKNEVIAKDYNQIDTEVSIKLNNLKFVDSKDQKIQSPNDNSQYYNDMINAFKKRFNKVKFSWESSFFQNIIGGIRFSTIEDEHQLANFIKQIESYLIKNGKISPAFFRYIGENVD